MTDTTTTTTRRCKHCGEDIERIPAATTQRWRDEHDWQGSYEYWHVPSHGGRHTVGCPSGRTTYAAPELTRFVYLVEGESYIGTVEDYAKADRNAHYAGLSVERYVFTFTKTDAGYLSCRHDVEFSNTDYNDDDYATVTVRVLGEEANWTLDGRA